MKLEEFKQICAKFGLKAVASKFNGENWTCYQYNNRIEEGLTFNYRTNIICNFDDDNSKAVLFNDCRKQHGKNSIWLGTYDDTLKTTRKDVFEKKLNVLMAEIRKAYKQERLKQIDTI